MPDKRKAYAPFSLITESGVSNAPVEGYIDVNQEIQPIVSTGVVNENGTWTGVKSDDKEFIGFGFADQLPDGESEYFPNTGPDPISINMNGFSKLQFAIKPSVAGTFLFVACQGASTNPSLNLSPINALENIRVVDAIGTSFEDLMSDSETCSAQVWSVFTIVQPRAIGQSNMLIRVRNNTGNNCDVEFAYRRLV